MAAEYKEYSEGQDGLRGGDKGYFNSSHRQREQDTEYEDNFDENGLETHAPGNIKKGYYPGEKPEEKPDEIPEKHQSENEPSEYPHETELRKPDSGSEVSYSEKVDVTPPQPHEFPSVGNAKADFESRPHGRKTARMIGHEPGTEGI